MLKRELHPGMRVRDAKRSQRQEPGSRLFGERHSENNRISKAKREWRHLACEVSQGPMRRFAI